MGFPSWAFLRGRPSSSPEHDYFNNNKNIFLQNLIKLGDVVVSRVHVGNTHWTERWPLINIHIKDQSITQSTQRHDPREIKYGPQDHTARLPRTTLGLPWCDTWSDTQHRWEFQRTQEEGPVLSRISEDKGAPTWHGSERVLGGSAQKNSVGTEEAAPSPPGFHGNLSNLLRTVFGVRGGQTPQGTL